jgi:hypothetical protein
LKTARVFRGPFFVGCDGRVVAASEPEANSRGRDRAAAGVIQPARGDRETTDPGAHRDPDPSRIAAPSGAYGDQRAERDLGGDARTPSTVRFPAIPHGDGDSSRFSCASHVSRPTHEEPRVEQEGRSHFEAAKIPAPNDAISVQRRRDREVAGAHASRDAEPRGPSRSAGLQRHPEGEPLDSAAE